MKHWRHTAARLLLAANVAAGLCGEALHHETLTVRLSADPVVASHRCGDRERHVPLDSLHPCTLCTGFSQRVSTAVPPQAVAAPVRILLGTFARDGDETLSADRPFYHTRGPPAA
jgi:hypothetical protein